MKNNTAVILPTYNSASTIVEVMKRVRRTVPAATIYVVDDSSPDKTADMARRAFQHDNHVKLIVRQGKGGRGSAVIAGIREALRNKDVLYFIEMDTDLCHDPKYIPQLIEKCRSADVVIASKNLRASKVEGLTIKRKILSKLMNMGARTILQVPITDYSNGFRCYSRRAAEYIVKRKFIAKGFVVLSEIAYICYRQNFKLIEIPFHFKQQRTDIASNLRFSEMKEAFLTLLRLRFWG